MHITRTKHAMSKSKVGKTLENVHFTENDLHLCTSLSLSFQFLTCHHPLKRCVEGPYQGSATLKSLPVGFKGSEPSR